MRAFFDFLVAACFLAVLAGCGGGSFPSTTAQSGASTLTPPQVFAPTAPVVKGTSLPVYPDAVTRAGSFAPQPGTDYVFIADQNLDQIDIFSVQAGCQTGTITAGIRGPYGLWFDTDSRLLYVANQANNTVTAYTFGSVTPAVTYSQDLERPLYPVTDRDGNLYVGNANNGTVVEYLAGSTSVNRVLTAPGEVDGLAFDRQGNLYAAFRHSDADGDASIEEFPVGSSIGEILGMSITAPQGIILDANGNIVVAETQDASRIDVFPPGSTNPSFQTGLPSGTPTEVAIDFSEADLYVSSFNTGLVNVSKYPLPGQSFAAKFSVTPIIQGVTITDNQDF